jgi:hypothetical protein
MTQKEVLRVADFLRDFRAVKLLVATFPEIRYCREIVRFIVPEASSIDGAP